MGRSSRTIRRRDTRRSRTRSQRSLSIYGLVYDRLRADPFKKQQNVRCPAHDDRQASLSVTLKDGRILLHCQAGCTYKKIEAAAQVAARDLIVQQPASTKPREVAIYQYRDEYGTTLYEHVRYEPKDFRFRQ